MVTLPVLSYQHILSTHPINASYQHILPTHLHNTSSYQHILPTHPINTSYQHTLSAHPINTPYQHILPKHLHRITSREMVTLPVLSYQHTLSTHSLTCPLIRPPIYHFAVPSSHTSPHLQGNHGRGTGAQTECSHISSILIPPPTSIL